MKIFVSSTIKDLGDLRNNLYHQLKELGHTPWFSEQYDFPINFHPDSMTNCIMVAENCDLFVVILDKHAGLPYTEREKSSYNHFFGKTISEAEYLAAKEKGKKVCIFIRTRAENESAIYRQKSLKNQKLIKWYSEPAVYEYYDRLMHDESNIPWRYKFENVIDIIEPLKKITGNDEDQLFEINEQDILLIQEGKKKDNLQPLMDDIINNFNNENLSSFRDLIEILDCKWNTIIDGFNKSSNTKIISSYFGEHYRSIMFKLIERQASFDYCHPILKSFHCNIKKFILSRNTLDRQTYLADSLYFSNVFRTIIQKSINELNDSVFRTTVEMLTEQMDSAIEVHMNDFNVCLFYISNFKLIINDVCNKNHDEINFISVRLNFIGKSLAQCEFNGSLMKLLDGFNSLIDYEIKLNKQNDLIITQRSLMCIWLICSSSRTEKCNNEIINILKKIDALPSLNVTLTIAYSKTRELIADDKEKLQSLAKIVDKLDILKRIL